MHHMSVFVRLGHLDPDKPTASSEETVSHVIVSSLLVFVFLLSVHWWRNKFGHLDTIFQQILCKQNIHELFKTPLRDHRPDEPDL